ncbi:L10-interacting MYB domain-containing protein-like [Silene latifolia]|uniref:L10-interacting MYB domain-containing protein-like n=1 Tax=Silene latifolia TaxID=37657 RepID=UPI003D77EFCB
MHRRFASTPYSTENNNTNPNVRVTPRAPSSMIYHPKMMKSQHRVRPTDPSNFVPKKEKANWDRITTKIFCEICAEEVHVGNRPNTHFNRVGWENVTWKQLIGPETGLGWDHEKGTIDADDTWWDEKENVNPEVANFRHGGVENLKEMEIMFSKTFATGNDSFNPYIVNQSNFDEGYDAPNE